jgi:ubiquinone/menaquinone biosynthesis C-methylase UbiE
MDYDETEIPATYDKARALAPETRRLWQGLLSAHMDLTEMSLVIDLGCGTGCFSDLLAAHFGVQRDRHRSISEDAESGSP